ncbi:methyltransferase domain-containing protein [candidate division CSSED10-310 bacterium]|uniref:Methyltransferase domain-containing protein n=1 Tax=candidate division CSSED10-310 bacterium TaxID=2855610 RepID=A0ABV6YWP2_UNCC1
MRKSLFQKLRCLDCRSINLEFTKQDELNHISPGEIICRSCGRTFYIKNRIPILLKEDIFKVKNLIQDRMVNLEDHDNWKKMQVQFYENSCSEKSMKQHEMARPHNQSRLYQYLQYYDLRLASQLYGGTFVNKTILSFGCGGGMDAEFFWQKGALVGGLDISHTYLQIAQKRFADRQVDFETICCDAEDVPIQSESFDICYAFDALHHCPDPYRVIEEMIRISREAIIIMEPNSSPIISLSVKLGMTRMWEASGNYKHYFKMKQMRKFLHQKGINSIATDFSFFKKFHFEPPIFIILSKFPLFQMIKAVLYVLRKLLGSLSNHCIVYFSK